MQKHVLSNNKDIKLAEQFPHATAVIMLGCLTILCVHDICHFIIIIQYIVDAQTDDVLHNVIYNNIYYADATLLLMS